MESSGKRPDTELREIGDRLYAYVTGRGDWAESNAGLVVGDGRALLVDTLIDVPSTALMLEEMRRADPAAKAIGTLVNTHADGDHTWGNQLAEGAEIITSSRAAAEFDNFEPAAFENLGSEVAQEFFDDATGRRVDLSTVILTRPTRTFDGALTLRLGERPIELIDVGAAHSGGDVLVYLPDDRVVFTGDLVFNRVIPMFWGVAPIVRWIEACDRILELDVTTIVPGHGGITDKSGARELRDYLDYLQKESKRCFDAGLSAEEAAREIADGGGYADWPARERAICNVLNVYGELGGDSGAVPPPEVFRRMGEWYFAERGRR